MFRIRISLSLLFSCVALAAFAQKATADQTVPNFALLDYRGKHYELRRADAKIVVLYFTSLNCPIARQSVAKLQKMQKELDDKGVVFWMINTMPQEVPGESTVNLIADLAARGQLGSVMPENGPDLEATKNQANALGRLSEFLPRSIAIGDREEFKRMVMISRVGTLPFLDDEHQLVTHQFGVDKTCEAIAIDALNSTIFYRGAVDDRMVPGAQRPKARNDYLADALNEFLAGKPVSVPQSPVHGCRIRFNKELTVEEPISYSEKVAPVLKQKCVGCHSPGNIGPFALSNYDSVVNWSAMIEEVVLDRRMPPWDADPHYGKFVNDRSLTGSEKRTLLKWIKQGCPKDDGEDPLAAPTKPLPKWQLGEPDYIVKLPSPQTVPPTGVLDYRYLDSDFVMPKDGWIRAAVCRAGNAKVVHHMIVRIRYPSHYRSASPEAYMFTTWAPGVPQGEFPENTGVFVPKGSRFNFEMHYTTDGLPHTDQSEMGLYLAEKPPKMKVEVRASETRDLLIPPGEQDAQHACYYCFKRDVLLYDLGPHMHLRGSWFRFSLLYPDGTREMLLSVPRYDFNWQGAYRLAKPKRIPAGTWMVCTGGFDNSDRNPHNPDSEKQVKWGLQTWDEMFMGFFTVAEIPTEADENSPGDSPLAQADVKKSDDDVSPLEALERVFIRSLKKLR